MKTKCKRPKRRSKFKAAKYQPSLILDGRAYSDGKLTVITSYVRQENGVGLFHVSASVVGGIPTEGQIRKVRRAFDMVDAEEDLHELAIHLFQEDR